MQCSSSQRVRLPFTFLSTHCHSEFREFSMITGMAPDSSLIKIFSRTNWRTLMVWFWEPHPSTSHRTHIRLGLKWHFNFRQRDFEKFLDFFRIYFKKWILDPCIRKRMEAGVAGNFSSWKLSHQTSTLPWTFRSHPTGSSGGRTRTGPSQVGVIMSGVRPQNYGQLVCV